MDKGRSVAEPASVCLKPFKSHAGGNLSDCRRRRRWASITCSSASPQLLLMDEPLAALDAARQAEAPHAAPAGVKVVRVSRT
ncbi:MAG TPA: hypothetical protein VLA61_03230 [Ideonella sp.]|nr:hypothetical protein [Ideonella sp.]